MNNYEVLQKVSENTGIDVADCEKVLNALEDVLDDELSNSKSAGAAFEKVYKLMTYFNNKGRS